MAGAGGMPGTAGSGLLPADPRRAQRGQDGTRGACEGDLRDLHGQRACLEYAIRIREPHGIWGGLNEVERKQLAEQR